MRRLGNINYLVFIILITQISVPMIGLTHHISLYSFEKDFDLREGFQ